MIDAPEDYDLHPLDCLSGDALERALVAFCLDFAEHRGATFTAEDREAFARNAARAGELSAAELRLQAVEVRSREAASQRGEKR